MKYLLIFCLALWASTALIAQCPNDKTPPLLVPETNLTVALGGPRCVAELQPASLLQSYSDNCAPTGLIELRVRSLGAGSGFPVAPNGAQLTLTPADLPGPALAEVWARDTSGNTAFTFVSIQLTNPSGCSFALLPDTLQAGEAQENVTWTVVTQAGQTSDTIYISGDGRLPLAADLFAGASQDNELTIWPTKDHDPLNGISTLDLVIIYRHLLEIKPFNHAIQFIAADVDRNYVISLHDASELRKLILGIYTVLLDNTSWRFIPDDYVFPPPSNPIAGPIPESVTFDRHRTEPLPDFIAVKVGDVSGNAVTSSLFEFQPRSCAAFTVPDMRLERGQSVRVPVRLSEFSTWHGLQAAFEFDSEQLQITSLAQGTLPDFSADNFFQPEPGVLTLSWVSPVAWHIGATDPLFYLEVTATEPLMLSNTLRLRQTRLKAEAYLTEDRTVDLSLAFDPLPIPGTDEVLPAYPNPAAGDFFVPVRLAKDKPVRLEVFDATGGLLYFFESDLPAGEHRMRVPVEQLTQSGILVYRVAIDGTPKASGRVAVSPK
jgi:hypothetical protein